MSNPDVPLRKPKPEAMPRFSRLVAVLCTKKAARPRMMAATTTWKMIPRMNSLCQNEEEGLRATVSRAVIEQTLRDGAKRVGAPDPSSGSDAPFWPLLPGSADGRSVLQTALVPQLVQAAGQAQRRLQADIALEAFAVVADLLDDVIGPVLGHAHHLAHVVFHAQHAAHFRILRGGFHLVDIGLGDSLLFGDQHHIERPAHDVGPVVVAMAHGWPQRFLGDDLRQDDVVRGVLQLGALGSKAR